MGPTCSILLDKKIDIKLIINVDNFLSSIVSNELKTPKMSREFWIDENKFPKILSYGSNCAFSLTYGNKLRTFDENVKVELELALDFNIESQITISAGCNQQGDHNVLCELIYEIALITEGLIDFGYNILDYNFGEEKKLNGTIYGINYNNGMAINHVIDTEYFKNWMMNNIKNIRMVK